MWSGYYLQSYFFLSLERSVAAAVKLNKQASEICINWGGGQNKHTV